MTFASALVANPVKLLLAGAAVLAVLVVFVFSGGEEGTVPAGTAVEGGALEPTEGKHPPQPPVPGRALPPPWLSGGLDTAKSGGSDIARPAFDIVRISRSGTGIIAGRMQPGAIISLKANGEEIATVTADENGEWVILLDEPLESGSVEFTLNGKTGSAAIEGEEAVIVSVPVRDGTDLMERTESGVVALLTSVDGEGGSTVLQRPGVRAPADIGDKLSIITVDYGDGGVPVISGTGVPRFDVLLYVNEAHAGRGRVGDEGSWRIPLDQDFSTGEQLLRVDQVIGDGSVQLRIEQPFTVGEAVDLSASKNGVLVQPGNTLWNIARQIYGSGTRYTVIFRENSEKIIDPNLIYPGQLFQLPDQAATTKD